MLNIVFYHPYLFTTLAALFLFGVFIMVYEIRRAIRVPDDYEEEYVLFKLQDIHGNYSQAHQLRSICSSPIVHLWTPICHQLFLLSSINNETLSLA